MLRVARLSVLVRQEGKAFNFLSPYNPRPNFVLGIVCDNFRMIESKMNGSALLTEGQRKCVLICDCEIELVSRTQSFLDMRMHFESSFCSFYQMCA